MDAPFRQALTVFSNVRYQVHTKRDAKAEINYDVLNQRLQEIKQLVMEAGIALKKVLMWHMKVLLLFFFLPLLIFSASSSSRGM